MAVNHVVPEALDGLDRGVLVTVLYADLFDYPLTRVEIHRRLAGIACDRSKLDASVNRLIGTYLEELDDYVTWVGRQQLVEVRERREHASEALLPVARRYTRWLARTPFVRMVAVSGSLAVRNSEATTDIDLFCVTEANRLWLARCWMVPLAKLTRRLKWFFPRYLCANTVVSLAALEVDYRSLYTASEVTQALPVWGRRAYRRFVSANAWAFDLFPQMPRVIDIDPEVSAEAAGESREEQCIGESASPRPLLTLWFEMLCAGRFGDALDTAAHRLFVALYRLRATTRGQSWDELAPAYQRQRYTVPRGGYLPVVRRRFLERLHERLGETVAEAEMGRLFPTSSELPPPARDWEANFSDEYGDEWIGSEVADPRGPQ